MCNKFQNVELKHTSMNYLQDLKFKFCRSIPESMAHLLATYYIHMDHFYNIILSQNGYVAQSLECSFPFVSPGFESHSC